MTTPAMRHQARIRQQQAEAKAKAQLESRQAEQIETLAGDYDQHQLLLASLEQDCQRLHGLSQEAKDTLKRDELVPRYRPVVQAYLEAGEAYKNPVLVQLMIWLFDLGEIEEALRLAAVAIEQQQGMPERFNRNLHTYVADALREWAEQQQANGDPIEPYFGDTFTAMRAEQWPVAKAALVKLHKVAGTEAQKRGELEAALGHFQEAQKQLAKQAQAEADQRPDDN